MSNPNAVNRIVLLNPPSDRVVLRDYFCSKSSQAGYLNPPIDFVIQSAFLSRRFDVQLIDAVASRLDERRCIERIRALSPDAVYSLTGFVSWREDAKFFSRLAAPRLILSGDIFLENPQSRLSDNPFVEAAILDFTTDSLARYLDGERTDLIGISYRSENGDVVPPVPAARDTDFSIPVPKHELFTKLPYKYPFVMGTPFATVLTEYGCPFKCGFCIMGQLGYRARPVENVLQELRHLSGLGVRDIFFLDQTFGSNATRRDELLDALRGFTPRFRWLCFSRADCAGPGVIERMGAAGCHTVIYGVESSNDAVLAEYGKGYSWKQVAETFKAAKRAGVRTVGTLLFGLPGDSPENCIRTVRDVKRAGCDYISINIAVPRMGTPMRGRALELGIIDKGLDRMDQSGAFIAMEHGEFTTARLLELKRRAIREFYLTPSYVARRIAAIRTPAQLGIEAGQAVSLMRNLVRSR